ncbi:MAG TPA: FecR family protein, partial [Spirochaetia bacterium]
MRLSTRDIVVIALVALLCSTLIFLFLRESNRVTLRAGEKALGAIVFKKLSATRRPGDGLLWERIRNNSPIYQADTLRTGESSEASVYFDDGTALDMLENSMLRLDFSKKGRSLDFLGGEISISGSAGGGNADLTGIEGPKKGGAGGSAGYTITTGGRTIVVSGGSRASVSRTGDTVAVDVSSGQVGVTDAAGRTETIDRSKALQIDLSAGTTQVVHRSTVLLAPEQNALLLTEGSGAKVPFSWRSEAAGAITLELSASRDFDAVSSSVQVDGGSVSLSMDPGTWYWRVRAADGGLSSVRRFTLFAELPPRPITPANLAVIRYRKTLPVIHFSWTRMEDATAYVFEVAADSGFTKAVLKN